MCFITLHSHIQAITEIYREPNYVLGVTVTSTYERIKLRIGRQKRQEQEESEWLSDWRAVGRGGKRRHPRK